MLPVAIQGLVADAPMPLLVGMHSENTQLERSNVQALEDVVIVDLDRDSIRWPAAALPVPPLPRYRLKVIPHIFVVTAVLSMLSSRKMFVCMTLTTMDLMVLMMILM